MDRRTFKRDLSRYLVRECARDGVPTRPSHELAQVARLAAVELARGNGVAPAVAESVVAEISEVLLAFGSLAMLVLDPEVSEIMVNGPSRVFVERQGRRTTSSVHLASEGDLRSIVERVLAFDPSKRLDATLPYVDVATPDGSRVNIAVHPVVLGGPHMTIRKFTGVVESLDDLMEAGTLDEDIARFLFACIRARVNLLFSGGAGAGKTTLLEILAGHIPHEERIVVIEDTLELHLGQPNVVRLLAKTANLEGKGQITIGDLFRNSLRMRPGRIILGEIRGAEAYDYLQSLSSGHKGSLAVVHASSPEEALMRLESLARQSAMDIPLASVRRQVSRGLDVVVQVEQLADGTRRVTRVTELAGQDQDGSLLVEDVFTFVVDAVTRDGGLLGHHQATGRISALNHRFALAGVPLPEALYAE